MRVLDIFRSSCKSAQSEKSVKGPAMLLMRNLSQVRFASYHERKGMGMLRINRILIFPHIHLQTFYLKVFFELALVHKQSATGTVNFVINDPVT